MAQARVTCFSSTAVGTKSSNVLKQAQRTLRLIWTALRHASPARSYEAPLTPLRFHNPPKTEFESKKRGVLNEEVG
jgi:hypothetical protein